MEKDKFIKNKSLESINVMCPSRLFELFIIPLYSTANKILVSANKKLALSQIAIKIFCPNRHFIAPRANQRISHKAVYLYVF